MLKLIYKTLLISLISGSLMLMDFSYKSGGLQVGMVTQAQAESLHLNGINESSVTNTLSLLALGLVTSRLYTCKMTLDMQLAAAGGLAFVAGEVVAVAKLRGVTEDIKKQLEFDKNNNITKEQIESLERLKKSYESAKSGLETRLMLQQVAGIAFAAAAVAAYSLGSQETAAVASCTSAIGTSAGACAQAFAASCSGAGATCVYPLQTGGMAIGATSGLPSANEAKSLTPQLSSTAFSMGTALNTSLAAAIKAGMSQCPLGAGAAAACDAMIAVNLGSRGWCPAPLVVATNDIKKINPALYAEAFTPIKKPATSSSPSLVSLFPTLFISEAKASMLTDLGIGAAAIATVLALSATIGAKIDAFLYSPFNRAWLWAAFAVEKLTLATGSTRDELTQVNKNIKKINEVIETMNKMADGTGSNQTIQGNEQQTSNIKVGSNINMEAVNYEDVELSSDGKVTMPCYTGSGSGDSCPAMGKDLNKVAGFSSLGPDSQKQISNLLSKMNGLNGTNKFSKATLKGLADIGSSANAIKANLDKAKLKNAELLKKNGIKTGADQQSKKMSDIMNKAINDVLKKQKTTAGAVLAGFGGGLSGSLSGSSTVTDKDSDAAKKAGLTGGQGNLYNFSTAPTAGSGAGSTTDDGMGLNAGADAATGEQLTAEQLAAYNKAAQEANAGGPDLTLKNDISDDADSTLFQQISNRYQRSAYPRLFKVKEKPAEL